MNLDQATQAHPAGTVFWLAPGRHTLGTETQARVAPKDGNTYIGAPGAILDGQKLNRYAFTQTAKDVTVRHLTIENFVAPEDEGVFNHDSGEGWTLEASTVRNNGGAASMAGARNTFRDNCLAQNGQYAINAWQPDDAVVDLVIDHNEIRGNNADHHSVGAGAKLWAARRVRMTHNWVHDNQGTGLWADTDSVEILVEGNLIEDNRDQGLACTLSYNVMIRFNAFRRNAVAQGQARIVDPFPAGAVFLANTGGTDSGGYQYSAMEIHHNLFEDNWDDVVLWEDADRFCGSPSNPSVGYCTLGATLDDCRSPTIASTPYLDLCRWKTQNVTVHHNLFSVDRAAIDCAEGSRCGRVALFASLGSAPDWSPYLGKVVPDAITSQQNDVFSANVYRGSRAFTAHEVGADVDLQTWQSLYRQDLDSTAE